MPEVDSRIIAKLTGKQHSHICRNIRQQLSTQGLDLSNFQFEYRIPWMNQRKLYYRISKVQSIMLMRNYSISMGIKMERWWKENV